MSVLKSLIFFLSTAAVSAFAVLCLWADMHIFGNNISEISLTEIIQESTLGLIVFIHFLLAKKYSSLRYCNILIGGFFLAMLIRELDAIFDLFFHGSWFWFALVSTLCSLVYPLIHFRQTLVQLAQYIRMPYYSMMLSGLLAILVFSRLLGMNALWNVILNDGYARVVKNAVEEGSESFGYMLCLMASAGYYYSFRQFIHRPHDAR